MAVVALLALFAQLGSACGGAGTPPTLDPQVLPDATVGQYYEVELSASGGATVTTPNLPSNGLRMLTGTGHALLFGVPSTAGTSTINVTAIVGGPTMFQTPASTERAYTLTVDAATGDDGLVVEDTLLDFTADVPLSVSLGASVRGGTAPYTFGLYCLDRGEVCADPQPTDLPPDGVTLSADGALSGTVGPETGTHAYPNERRYDFIVCVTDSSANHACALVEMWEQPPPSAAAT
ncbi:MAG TPA: hypothetical protein VM284_07415 [Candidatus Limnocylindria bacterium]|nr:hypothetical protein [Candidatus Limnocylindria bacterium]